MKILIVMSLVLWSASSMAFGFDLNSVIDMMNPNQPCRLTENPGLSQSALEKNYATAMRKKDSCAAAVAAAELAWETGSDTWAEKAMKHLHDRREHRTAMLFGLRFLRTLGGNSETVRISTLLSLRDLIFSPEAGRDVSWMGLALQISPPQDQGAAWLSIPVFKNDFPDSKHLKKINAWHEEIFSKWFEHEKSVVVHHLERGATFSALQRLESILATPHLPESKIFTPFFTLWQRTSIRLLTDIDSATNAELRIWSKIPGSEKVNREGFKKFILKNTCAALGAFAQQKGARSLASDLASFRQQRCRGIK